MDNKNPYFRQVELLVRILPLVGEHPCFALKGDGNQFVLPEYATSFC